MTECGILNPFACYAIPAASWIGGGLTSFVGFARPFFLLVKQPIDTVLVLMATALNSTPPMVIIVLFALLAWRAGGVKLAVSTVLSLLVIGFLARIIRHG